MTIKFICPHWGSAHLSWNDFTHKVKASGYDGIEYAVTRDTPEKTMDEVWTKAERDEQVIVVQHYDTYEAGFSEHYDLYAAWLEKVSAYKPLKVNSQTGKDFFTFDQNKALIDLAAAFTRKTGIEVCHETHRNKFSFAAHVTREYLQRIPYLNLTLDASHWVCVAESYLDDQEETMHLAISRTEHIHARIGYPEGPQVSDPRAPEWQEAVQTHLVWWDKVIRRKRENGSDIMTVCPEFGPVPYMQTLPYTGEPLASQWDINEYMMNLLKARWC